MGGNSCGGQGGMEACQSSMLPVEQHAFSKSTTAVEREENLRCAVICNVLHGLLMRRLHLSSSSYSLSLSLMCDVVPGFWWHHSFLFRRFSSKVNCNTKRFFKKLLAPHWPRSACNVLYIYTFIIYIYNFVYWNIDVLFLFIRLPQTKYKFIKHCFDIFTLFKFVW